MEMKVMSIERDSKIEFHPSGTLTSAARWIRSHNEGIAEWLKNTRRAYQPDTHQLVSDDFEAQSSTLSQSRMPRSMPSCTSSPGSS
jgi:hypothetical protein